ARSRTFKYAHEAITWHFAGLAADEIVTTSRQFPAHMRADVQAAIDKLFSASALRVFGLYQPHRSEPLTYSSLMKQGSYAATISAAQFRDVDVGDDAPVKCLENGLWLNRDGGLNFTVVFHFYRDYGHAVCSVEIAVPAGEEG